MFETNEAPATETQKCMFLTDDRDERAKTCVNYRSPPDADSMSY